MSLPASNPPTTTPIPQPLRNLYTIQSHNHVAEQTPQRALVSSWTSSITHLCRNGRLAKAAKELTRMRLSGINPNHITLLNLVSGCAKHPSSQTLRFGTSIHAYICKWGLNKNNVMVGTALVHMYSECAHIDSARRAFDDMYIDVRNSISWNTMIDGYMRNGEINSAVNLFDEMPDKDIVSWTALIGGFVKKGEFEKALECFQAMQLSGLQPDHVTVLAVIGACANLGVLTLGMWLHHFIVRRHSLRNNIRVNNSLIDMYSRCGCIEFAREQFHNMPKRTLVSWNSIIGGLAANGHAKDALVYFSLMQGDGFKPNGVSYVGALTACSHAGLIEDGIRLYNSMIRVDGISPRIEHYGCMVDLYSRAGRLEEAFRVIESMPMKPNEVVIGSLLAACRTRGDFDLATRLMRYDVELKPGSDSNRVLISNIYAEVGRWDGVGVVRKRMKEIGMTKARALSSIEVDCSIHEFGASDRSHLRSRSIYEMLDHLHDELRIHGLYPRSRICRPQGG